jgi:hypothetical protein
VKEPTAISKRALCAAAPRAAFGSGFMILPLK